MTHPFALTLKRLGLPFCLLFCVSLFGDYKGLLYFEGSYDPLAAVLRNNMKARMENTFTPWLSVYALGGQESASLLATPFYMRSGSFAYGGPGVKARYDNFTFTADIRFRKFMVLHASPETVNIPLTDVQILTSYDDYWYSVINESPVITRFAELYTETVFTSADYSNIIHNTSVRGGLETKVVEKGYLAAFIEPQFFLDKIGHYYNNRAELRLSLRVRYAMSPVSINLTGTYLFNQYFHIKRFDPFPPPTATAVSP